MMLLRMLRSWITAPHLWIFHPRGMWRIYHLTEDQKRCLRNILEDLESTNK